MYLSNKVSVSSVSSAADLRTGIIGKTLKTINAQPHLKSFYKQIAFISIYSSTLCTQLSLPIPVNESINIQSAAANITDNIFFFISRTCLSLKMPKHLYCHYDNILFILLHKVFQITPWNHLYPLSPDCPVSQVLLLLTAWHLGNLPISKSVKLNQLKHFLHTLFSFGQSTGYTRHGYIWPRQPHTIAACFYGKRYAWLITLSQIYLFF